MSCAIHTLHTLHISYLLAHTHTNPHLCTHTHTHILHIAYTLCYGGSPTSLQSVTVACCSCLSVCSLGLPLLPHSPSVTSLCVKRSFKTVGGGGHWGGYWLTHDIGRSRLAFPVNTGRYMGWEWGRGWEMGGNKVPSQSTHHGVLCVLSSKGK